MECRHKFTMCRLCLSESVSFVDIFHVNERFGYVTAEVMQDLLQFHVSEMDGYPHVVCSICLGKLKDFKQFKEKCQHSRDTYNNVFASGESNIEHPIDIEEPRPMKLEPKDPLDTQETVPEVELKRLSLEHKDPFDAQGTQQEMRKCSVALTRLDYLAFLRKRARCESYGANENGSSSVNDGGNPSSTGRKKIAVDADQCENVKSSGSADVKVGKMDVNVRKDYKSSGDTHRLESSVQELRREIIDGQEEVNCCTTGLDEDEVFTLKLESSSESDGESEGGEEAPLGVNEREKEYFRCNDCRQEFDKKEALIRHLGVHGSVVNMENSSEERDLQENTDVNCGSKRKTNEVCKKGLKRKLSDKVKRVEGVRKYVCDSCGQGFNKMSKMEIHLRIHTGEKPFFCTICGKEFNLESNLKTHKLTHTGAKPYGCEVCGRYFARKSVLIIHGRTHTGEKPYGCEVCGRYFAHRNVLINHGRTHTGEKPYGCEVCGRYFACKRVLIDHGRTHTGEKPYTCEICCKGFAQKLYLLRHRRIHSGEKPYKCEECNMCYSLRSSLRRHLRIHSQGKPFTCEVCSKTFRDRYHLGRHLRIHSQDNPIQ